MVEIAFANEIKNGFEEKEKKEKENLKIKVFFLSCKIYFWEFTQNCLFLFELKMYFKPWSNLIWFIF